MKDPCLKYACELQKCLQANDYKEELCTKIMEDMLTCCEKWKEKAECCLGFLNGKDKTKKE